MAHYEIDEVKMEGRGDARPQLLAPVRRFRAEDLDPLIEGPVGGDQDGAPLVALAENLFGSLADSSRVSASRRSPCRATQGAREPLNDSMVSSARRIVAGWSSSVGAVAGGSRGAGRASQKMELVAGRGC